MVYPVFEENSIIDRCKNDLEQFLKIYSLPEGDNFRLEVKLNNSNYKTFEDMKNAIQPLIEKLEIVSGKSLGDFNYVSNVFLYYA